MKKQIIPVVPPYLIAIHLLAFWSPAWLTILIIVCIDITFLANSYYLGGLFLHITNIRAKSWPVLEGRTQKFSIESISYYGHWACVLNLIGLNTVQRYKIIIFGFIPNMNNLL